VPLRDRALRGALWDLVRAGSSDGLAGVDAGRLRMTFPCRLRIRLHGGRVVDVEGEEPGASAHPVDEQRAVVARRAELAAAALAQAGAR
jgi:hypothetical protein